MGLKYAPQDFCEFRDRRLGNPPTEAVTKLRKLCVALEIDDTFPFVLVNLVAIMFSGFLCMSMKLDVKITDVHVAIF